jgi:multidrug efflux pump subunit AcrB
MAGVMRFRPILLTSLTTIGGLTPLLLEKSRQAQWLIPMAVSLAGGIAFATLLTLFLVPMFYLIFEDIRLAVRRWWLWAKRP